MMPQLTGAFGVNALGVSAIVGMFYYGYPDQRVEKPEFGSFVDFLKPPKARTTKV
jgi:hypothetical protein